jgi:hypothetical protein
VILYEDDVAIRRCFKDFEDNLLWFKDFERKKKKKILKRIC